MKRRRDSIKLWKAKVDDIVLRWDVAETLARRVLKTFRGNYLQVYKNPISV